MTEQEQGVCFRIFGRVQGVGFRYFTHKRALAHAVRGTVQNEPDGHVFVQAVQTLSVLEAFRKDLEKGPVFAKVTRIETSPLEREQWSQFTEFHIHR